MPLIDSGSALFAGSSREFAEMAPASRLTAHLVEAFRARWGRVSDSEIRSWKNSLTALADVVTRAGLDGTGVGVELKLPATDRRVDAFFVGHSQADEPGVVLVELKQWSSASPSLYPDQVIVGGAEHLHPSVQAASYAEYLRGSHSAFSEDGLALRPCAYLHNMAPEDAASMRGVRFEGATTDAQFYVRGDEDELAGLLHRDVGRGDGMSLLPKVIRGRYRPSMQLMDSVRRSLKASPVWTLLDEQRMAFNIVRGLTERAAKTGEKAVIVVSGGPGTGKSVIAVHLMVSLAQQDGRAVAHATGSKAFTTNLRALVPGGQAVFRYFNNFMAADCEENAIDVLIADEAHRIRKSSNGQWTSKAKRSDISQVEELIRAARVSVFFLDERQNVRPDEIGSIQIIEDTARRLGIDFHRQSLDAQFRCNGCPQYIEWVDRLLSPNPEPAGGWLSAGDYDLRTFSRVDQMEAAVLEQTKLGNTGRLAAGFCWPWSDPNSDGSLVEDVVIEGWSRPWNEKAPDQWKGKKGAAPRPDRHPYVLWANQPERVREVGCIYSAQGFEFDYFGVILGNDLVWRDGVGWVASRDASMDPMISRRKLSQADLLALLQQTYRVLLTRGMKGTFVYSTDWETQLMLTRLIGEKAQ
ncbi:MAG: DUF2075 domain-containing protein [Candidatus Eisenbacteria bacterium]